MAKALRPIVGGITRTGKKIYITVSNLHKKTKKIYDVVGGVFRLAWSSAPSISYAESIVTMPYNYYYFTSNKSYFMGLGYTNSSDAASTGGLAYNMNTLTSTTVVLNTAHSDGATSTNGEYAVVAGGKNGYLYPSQINLYSTALLRTVLSGYGGTGGAGARFGTYALVAGGSTYSGSSYNYSYVVLAINESGTQSGVSLSRSRASVGSAFNDAYVLFCGGYDSNTSNDPGFALGTVDAFNSSLVRTAASALSNGARGCKGGNIGDYAIVIGGNYWGQNESGASTSISNQTMQVYNKELVKTTPISTMPVAISNNTVIGSHKGVSIISGAQGSSSVYLVYNNELVYTTQATAQSSTGSSTVSGNDIFFKRSLYVSKFSITE